MGKRQADVLRNKAQVWCRVGVGPPSDASVLFQHLKCTAADQRQRSGSALGGIKSH